MSAADRIAAARALIEPLRATVLWQNANPNVMKAADLLAALADLADAQAQELEAQSVELARAKSRGDNHWETLKGIRHIAKTSGDLERIILWVDDAGSGYTALPETSLAEVCNERNAARAEADAQAQEIAKLKHVAVDLAASLAAAISLLERGGKAAKKAAPSDRMFDQMKADYHASLTRARAALGETT